GVGVRGCHPVLAGSGVVTRGRTSDYRRHAARVNRLPRPSFPPPPRGERGVRADTPPGSTVCRDRQQTYGEGRTVRRTTLRTAWLAAFSAGLALLPSAGRAAEKLKRPPNFVIIFADDQGYGDLG